MQKVSVEVLKKACEEFAMYDEKAGFYEVAAEIADEHPLQASILILATWNTEPFVRYFIKRRKNLSDLKEAIEKCKMLINRIKYKEFRSTNFDEIADIVKEIYITLSRIEGVRYTGATKVMHLLHRDLFVMWDDRIRRHYGCDESADGYLRFLKTMQAMFKDVEWSDPNKPLTKAIDEYNFVTITLRKKDC